MVEESPTVRGPLPAGPLATRRRTIVALRGVLIVAVGAIVWLHGPAAHVPQGAGATLLVLFALSALVLVFAPQHVIGNRRFETILAAIDVAFVAAILVVAGAAEGVLPVTALLMAIVVAVVRDRGHVAAVASVVGAVHVWLALAPSVGPVATQRLALEIALLAAIALYFGFLARAIHRQRQRHELDRLERRELRTLLEILDAVSSSLNLRTVAGTIVAKINEVIPAVRCSMLFVDPAGTRCYVLASHDDPSVDMLEVDLDKYPEVRRAIETCNPVLVQNVPDDPILSEVRAALAGLSFRSILVVPLAFGGRVLGTICLKTVRATDEFSSREVDFCRAVARASANAVQNALLHDQVRIESSRLRTTSETLSRILDQSPELVLVTDVAGKVAETSGGAARLLGRSGETLRGRALHELLGGAASGAQTLVSRVLAGDGAALHELRVTRGDGVEIDLELNAGVLRAGDGEPSGTVWVGRDVTALKLTQLQLLQAKKLSTIGEVISGLAHELNNPLSGVLGFSQLLVSRHREGDLARDLGRIHESALRCGRIVRDLFAFSRAEATERRYLDVNDLLQQTIELRRSQLEADRIEIVTRLDPDLPRTMLDFRQMQQVLLNMFSNARQAMAARPGERGRLTVETRASEGSLRIVVGDNGVGMGPETLERIFDPFFTTREPGQGTGLGLSVSYGIVGEHGGRIWAESRPGSGATFTIELPVCRDADVGASAPRRSTTGRESTGDARFASILVVDDEPMILDLMSDVLGTLGYRVDTAANGGEASRKIEARPYDLVLTDVRMPQMSGLQLYDRILALRPEMVGHVVFMTGDMIDRETSGFLAATCAPSISKPLELDVVATTIGAVLAERVRH